MKKFLFITGSLFSALILMSFVFKMLHLQGAPQLLLVGTIGLIVFFVALAKYLYDRTS